MNLQELLGESFHDGMTYDEVATALSGMKLADLSTGAYVDTNKYNTDLKAKDTELTNIKAQLNNKLSDSEKEAANKAANEQRITELEELLKTQTITGNRDKADALTSDIRSILDIKDDDINFNSLLDMLSKVDNDSVKNIASYINKLVKDSYEKGKTDTTKDNLGSFSKDIKGGSQSKDEVGSLGKQLAKGSVTKVDPNLYFK